MSFTMSGADGWSYSRFDEFEKELKEGKKPVDSAKVDASVEKAGKAEKEADAAGDYQEADKQSRRQRAMRNQGKMNEEHLEERLDDMPAGDVGHEIHKKAVKANQSAVDAVNAPKKKAKAKDVKEGWKPLPQDKMMRQAHKAYRKEEDAVKRGDSEGATKQMKRRFSMEAPDMRKAALDNKKAIKKEELNAIDMYAALLDENRQAAYTAGESEKGSRGPAKVTGGTTHTIADLPKLKEPSAEEKAKARKALGLKKEALELFTADEIAALGLVEAKEDDCECDDEKKDKKKSDKKGGKFPFIAKEDDKEEEEDAKKD